MTKEDYYTILGVSRDSSKEEIKKAYKKLAKQYHPDISKDSSAEEKFKKISEAYAVLSDDTKKQQYDQFGHAGFDQRYSQEDIFRNFDFRVFDDIFGESSGFNSIFDMFFGDGRRRRRTSGSDLRYDIEISLKEAAKGVKKVINIPKRAVCDYCNGSGSKDGKLESCPDCKGSGQFTQTRRTPFGMFTQATICRNCSGEGKIIKNKCPECKGTGLTKEIKKIEVTIPEGVDTGSQLRLMGEGEAIRNGAPGDLYVVIHVAPSEIFERRDDDLFLRYPITFSQAALGIKVKIPTLESSVELKIPAGTESGTILRLKGKGISHLHHYGTGDLYIEVNLRTPQKLTKNQKQLFEQLSKEEKEDKSFFEKLKDSFK